MACRICAWTGSRPWSQSSARTTPPSHCSPSTAPQLPVAAEQHPQLQRLPLSNPAAAAAAGPKQLVLTLPPAGHLRMHRWGLEALMSRAAMILEEVKRGSSRLSQAHVRGWSRWKAMSCQASSSQTFGYPQLLQKLPQVPVRSLSFAQCRAAHHLIY